MKYMEKIEKRCSIREFLNREIEQEKLDEIHDYFRQIYRLIPDIPVGLRIAAGDTGSRMESHAGYMGKCFMAPAYLILLSQAADHYLINAGFIAEDLCLKLTEMGLDHCWLTVHSSDSVKEAAQIEAAEEVAAVIAFGYGKKERTKKRLDIFSPSKVNMVHRKGHMAPKIAQEDLVYQDKWGRRVRWEDHNIDPLLDQSLYAASLAPSFLNRQPYRYILRGRQVILCGRQEEMTSYNDTLLDLGATMKNFDAIASERDYVDWELGEPEDISRLKIPESFRVIAYYNWQ